ncbi:hypothetical protein NC653_010101 [Populus alba x Populus x berolinensis]|uniref:Uncharacterized protein n=1 Tax=Populus alba x Populus x berolinensis TaxID=444605 RepID=A0AAD6R0I4_9ROSI|nr:hypothetical protein NC653_010101 [Populus alba x Populus x berolinensis]
MLVECVSQTFAMTGALAWQVKKPNKKRFFWVLKGEMARDYLFIYFARLSPFCVMGSFFPSLSLNLLRIPITLHHTRNSRHQQESALPTTSIHHPKLPSPWHTSHCSQRLQTDFSDHLRDLFTGFGLNCLQSTNIETSSTL